MKHYIKFCIKISRIMRNLLNDYTDEGIDEYEKEAYTQLKDLKKQIRENPQVVLALDLPTWRYVVKS